MYRLPNIAIAFSLLASVPAYAAPLILHVKLDETATKTAASGRLLIFAQPLESAQTEASDSVPGAGGSLHPNRVNGSLETVDVDLLNPKAVEIAAQEIPHIAPGETVAVDADVLAFPHPFSQLKAGRYAVQAVLDVDHEYNYNFSDRRGGDLVSAVTEMSLPSGGTLVLSHVQTPIDPLTPPLDASAAQKADFPLAAADLRPFDVQSAALEHFWGRPIHMKGLVLLPPSYATGNEHYPVVYWNYGFSGGPQAVRDHAVTIWRMMHDGKLPPMIWVLLNEGSPTGTHEFADSVNNGPWGQALTTELIPQLEREYRMDARPSGRFLTGHSSGGWASLWLQVRYPAFFGGAWPTSPDPSDFHDWLGMDLYAPNANIYHRPDGSSWPFIQAEGKVLVTMEEFSKQEAVIGPVGGQMSSFEWVFSPRGPQGAPMAMFDRTTGAVNPQVIRYWHDHWDISAMIQREWPTLKSNLNGKIHLIVGSPDTFYLDGSARRLKAVLDGLGARSDFRFVPGRGHFDLYKIGSDPQGLNRTIAWEMYAIARPGVRRPADVPVPQVIP